MYQNSLLDWMGKEAFQASNLCLKPSRPLLSALKTEKEALYPLEVDLVYFLNYF